MLVDDGSTDDTAAVARAAGARVLELGSRAGGGNPAVARNRGALAATGDPLDLPRCGLPAGARAGSRRLLAGHDAGAAVVGGSLDLPPGLPPMARCDYYCGWYHVHSRRPAGEVPNHPPGNLSVRRADFAAHPGLHRAAAGRVRARGTRLAGGGASPAAAVSCSIPRRSSIHYNRPGFRNLLRRNYRWGFSAIESKAPTGAARSAWVYRYPAVLVAASVPLALGSAAYILWPAGSGRACSSRS